MPDVNLQAINLAPTGVVYLSSSSMESSAAIIATAIALLTALSSTTPTRSGRPGSAEILKTVVPEEALYHPGRYSSVDADHGAKDSVPLGPVDPPHVRMHVLSQGTARIHRADRQHRDLPGKGARPERQIKGEETEGIGKDAVARMQGAVRLHLQEHRRRNRAG